MLIVRLPLLKTVINENSTARSIHDSADLAIKRGTRSLDAAAKEMQNLKTELSTKSKKLTDLSEKFRQAVFDRDASLAREETTSTTLKKELMEVKNELANAKKEEGSDSHFSERRNASTSGGRKSRGGDDSLDDLRERERIKLDAFREKAEISWEIKEKGERRKRYNKQDNVCTIQQGMNGGGNPFGGGGARHGRRRDRVRDRRRSRSRSWSSSRSRSWSRGDSMRRDKGRSSSMSSQDNQRSRSNRMSSRDDRRGQNNSRSSRDNRWTSRDDRRTSHDNRRTGVMTGGQTVTTGGQVATTGGRVVTTGG